MNKFSAIKSRIQEIRRSGKSVEHVGLLFECFGVQAMQVAIKELCVLVLTSLETSQPESEILFNHCLLTLATEFKLNHHPDIRKSIVSSARLLLPVSKLPDNFKKIAVLNEEEIYSSVLECKEGYDELLDVDVFSNASIVPDLWILYRNTGNGRLWKIMCKFPDALVSILRSLQIDLDFVSSDEVLSLINNCISNRIVQIENIEWMFGFCERLLLNNAAIGRLLYQEIMELLGYLVNEHRFLLDRLMQLLTSSSSTKVIIKFNRSQLSVLLKLSHLAFKYPTTLFYDLIDSFLNCSDIDDKMLHMRLMSKLWDDQYLGKKIELILEGFLHSHLKGKDFIYILSQKDYQPFKGSLFVKYFKWQITKGLDLMSSELADDCLTNFSQCFYAPELPQFYISEYLETIDRLIEFDTSLMESFLKEFTPMLLEKAGNIKSKYPMVCELYLHFAKKHYSWFVEYIVSNEEVRNEFLNFFKSKDISAHGIVVIEIFFRCLFSSIRSESDIEENLVFEFAYSFESDQIIEIAKVCSESGNIRFLAYYLGKVESTVNIKGKISDRSNLLKNILLNISTCRKLMLKNWSRYFVEFKNSQRIRQEICSALREERNMMEFSFGQLKDQSEGSTCLADIVEMLYLSALSWIDMFFCFRHVPTENEEYKNNLITQRIILMMINIEERWKEFLKCIEFFKLNQEMCYGQMKESVQVLEKNGREVIDKLNQIQHILSNNSEGSEIIREITSFESILLESTIIKSTIIPWSVVEEYFQAKI